MKTFVSDNNSGIHPKILEAITKANFEHEVGYGEDSYTKMARDMFKKVFKNKDLDVYFVLNGTGANVVSVASPLRSYEGVITTDLSHLNTYEIGAFENFSGSKILTVPHENGKLNVDKLHGILSEKGNIHVSQPKIITITQLTELGTVYTLDEIKKIVDFAKKNNLYTHIDGARLCNGVAALNVKLEDIANTGVDMISFGGGKNGLMIGEAIVCFNKEISKHLKFNIKHGNQLVSKMRFISAQFIAYLEGELWRKNAESANNIAKALKETLEKIEGVEIAYPVEGNIVLATMPKDMSDILIEKKLVSIMRYEKEYVRFVTSFDSTLEDVNNIINSIN